MYSRKKYILIREKIFDFKLIVEAHTLVVSRNCDGILVSPMREEEPRDTTVMVSLAIVIGASVVFIVLLLAVVSLAFYRYRYNTIRTVNEIYQSFTIFGESPC